MMTLSTRFSCQLALMLAVAWAATAAPVCGEEGMWLPYELPDSIMNEMRLEGLELSRDEILNESETGVANAVVSLGATGAFVSPDGLILTNHHVAFGAVQRMSTPEKNYIEDGFLASTRDEEVPAFGYRAYIFKASEDVTNRVLEVTDPGMSGRERHDVVEEVIKTIVREAEEGRDVYCEVNAFFGGTRYILDTYLRLNDVRAVYVPSRAIGEYGGDIDNWMWPRHTGDFSFLRAYVAPDGSPADYSEANIPYKPSRYLKIAQGGLADGEFAMIIGYPGKTRRYLPSYALAHLENFEYRERVRLYKRMLEILEAQAAADPVARVRVASWTKGINNRLKNNQGMLDGFKKFDLVEDQRAREGRMLEALEADPEVRDEYRDLLGEFMDLYDEKAAYASRDLLLELLLERGPLVSQALLLYKWSLEKAKPDMERDPDFMDRKIPDLKRSIALFQRRFHLESDLGVARLLLMEMASLPDGERIDAVDRIVGSARDDEIGSVIDGFLKSLYGNTRLHLLDERMRMFELTHQELLAELDPFIILAGQLYEEDEARLERNESFGGELSILMPKWLGIIMAWSRAEIYPDANGTMRLNYGKVRGYSPRDAVYHEPFTRLRGVAEKHTGLPPFDCPERILELVAERVYGRYYDPAIGDVPVNLLTTHDSTGGNSGSPVLNGKGELVGCLFDGNYEAMTSDFRFQDDLTRSISVDIRYILYITEYVDGAQKILEELGVK
jgi:hypothetical protein